MADSLLFKVSSSKFHYPVELVKDIEQIYLHPGDVIFADPFAEKKIRVRHGNRVILISGEEQKNYAYIELLVKDLIDGGFKKDNTLYAIGGGVVQDVTGFIASILYRGVKWVFCPTTLVSQADSCIGSKTSINVGGYKNLLGTFYPPKQVLISTKFLATLPVREIKSGIGEIMHYYLIFQDRSAMRSLQKDYSRLLAKDERALTKHIITSLTLKKRYVQLDEFDRDIRNVYNYGHTFGHALEAISNFKLPHGIAVTIGMDMANQLAFRRKYISAKQYSRMSDFLKLNLEKFHLGKKKIAEFIAILEKDKKNTAGVINFILPKQYGRKVVMEKIGIAADAELHADITAYFKSRQS